jgi:16S rRNA processing protein RimM
VYELKVAESDLGRVIGRQGPDRQGPAHGAVGRLGQDAAPRDPRDPRVTSGFVTEEKETLPFGRLGRPHGVRGELTLRPFNADGALAEMALPAAVQLVRDQQRRPMTLVAVRPANELFLVRLEGVDTREQAALLTNFELWMPRASLPALAPDEFYVEDLIGCTLVDLDGARAGDGPLHLLERRPGRAHRRGAGRRAAGPAVAEFIREVDLAARAVVVDSHE